MIVGGNPGAGAVFPDPPTGSPGEIAAIARSLSGVGDDLEHVDGRLHGASATLAQDWQGWAAAAYHACSDGLASVARGGAESFHACAQAVAGYSHALEHAQSQIKRLRVLYDAATAAEASASSALGGLQSKLASTTKASAVSDLNSRIASAQTASQDAAFSATGYARQAAAVLAEFKHAEGRYTQVLAGARLTPGGGPAPGSPFRPFEPAGAPGPGFGVPATAGAIFPGLLAGAYGGVIPVGDPWASDIPGYGVYMDATHGNATSPGDLTNLIGLLAGGVIGPFRGLGEEWLIKLAAAVGVGGVGRTAVDEAEQKAIAKALQEALGGGTRRAEAQGLARAAGGKAAAAQLAAQNVTRSKLVETIAGAAASRGLLPTGAADLLTTMARGGQLYTAYGIAKLVALRDALARAGGLAGAHVIDVILRVVGR
jgi:uncharacterized protein YukE